MARTDAMVLGAGIVGTSIALQLVRRGLSVALVERAGVGEQTSFGNAGIIECNTVFPPAFPSDPLALLRVALKQATEANYHLSFLPQIAPWLMAYRAATTPAKIAEHAAMVRPLFSTVVAEHEALLTESGGLHYLRKTGWLKVHRNEKSFKAAQFERDTAAKLGLQFQQLDVGGALALEPSLNPVFSHAVFWPQAVSVSNPLGVTRAYLARFTALGGLTLHGDALTLHRSSDRWRVETDEGPLDAAEAVVALGPWARDLLDPMGLKLPLEVKRGYHRHFRGKGNASLVRPVLDSTVGYCITPMEAGIRMTTGVEFAARDAAPTPVQFDRIMPKALQLFPLGERADQETWLGRRPSFPDSRPIIGPAPGKPGLWLAIGHTHWGLTLGPSSGHLLADMITGTKPFVDPAPYRAERFGT
jgi:D-amino-acid dehydrogenase